MRWCGWGAESRKAWEEKRTADEAAEGGVGGRGLPGEVEVGVAVAAAAAAAALRSSGRRRRVEQPGRAGGRGIRGCR